MQTPVKVSAYQCFGKYNGLREDRIVKNYAHRSSCGALHRKSV